MGSYSSITIHATFATKLREPSLSKSVRSRLYPFLGGMMRQSNCLLLEVGGTADHVHLLFGMPTRLAVSDVLGDIKGRSSYWLNQEILQGGGFHWQKGFGAFSVSESHRPRLRRYIQNQERHHRRITFEEEMKAFLRHHGIPFKEGNLFGDDEQG